MGPKDRKIREREKVKKKILIAAVKLIIKDGYENLTIRKIAEKIEYTPGIIYHYFKNKQEIIDCIVEEGYSRVVERQKEIIIDPDDPAKTFKEMMNIYVSLMLETREEFKAVLMNDIKGTESKLSVLEKGISKKHVTFERLCGLIDLYKANGKFRELDSELTAQIIWTSMYGLTSKLVIEKNIGEVQKKRLIEHNVNILLNGLTNKS